MISIRIQQVTKRFGNVVALDQLSLEIEPGELFFLLGPSGCGKTTLLRSLAGFYVPDEGRIFFGDEDVTQQAPHKRSTGMMFQSYALWPHMTVAENVAFGLEERKVPRPEIQRRVAEALESVRMSAFGARRPNELSGGQQQRVALARALVVRPRCLLLDEPLSNLDARLRLEMRAEIRRVAKDFNLTTVYVTHDQKEALSVADRVAILDHGRVLQTGTPRDVYRRPKTRAIAGFVGDTDVLEGTVEGTSGGEVLVATEHGPFRGVLGDPQKPVQQGARVTLSVRPECWRLVTHASGGNTVRGTIGAAVFLGELAQYEVSAGEQRVKILELNPRLVGSAARQGAVTIAADPEDVVVLTE